MIEHTIVVRFPAGAKPTYSAATEFQGGQVVAVAFDGNRLDIAQELEEALCDMLSDRHCLSDATIAFAERALAKARRA